MDKQNLQWDRTYGGPSAVRATQLARSKCQGRVKDGYRNGPARDNFRPVAGRFLVVAAPTLSRCCPSKLRKRFVEWRQLKPARM